jgi:cytochrome c oxidase cbb3-type subunit 3
MKRLLLTLFALSFTAASQVGAQQPPTSFALCGACHGMDGKGNQALGAPNLTDDIWLHGYGENAIVAIINNGKINPMPTQADKLTEAQIHVLTAYVWGKSNQPKN